jgi:dolichol-phosphate mannosyltransferase
MLPMGESLVHDNNKWALVVPMASEEEGFHPFVEEVAQVLDKLQSGLVYIVVDNVSKDDTLALCKELSARDRRFRTIWAPENKNVVDAYLRGFREAVEDGHDLIIEMDAGLSHDPKAIPKFLSILNEGYDCVFGSRFIAGGSMTDSPLFRRALSKYGTTLSNLLLGTAFQDMTSGFQGFHASVIRKLLSYPLLSKAHFYQTEVKYLLRKHKYAETSIAYKAPSARVTHKAIYNSLAVLAHYTWQRFTFRAVSL